MPFTPEQLIEEKKDIIDRILKSDTKDKILLELIYDTKSLTKSIFQYLTNPKNNSIEEINFVTNRLGDLFQQNEARLIKELKNKF